MAFLSQNRRLSRLATTSYLEIVEQVNRAKSESAKIVEQVNRAKSESATGDPTTCDREEEGGEGRSNIIASSRILQ